MSTGEEFSLSYVLQAALSLTALSWMPGATVSVSDPGAGNHRHASLLQRPSCSRRWQHTLACASCLEAGPALKSEVGVSGQPHLTPATS